MPINPHDISDTLTDLQDARDFESGRSLRRLKRYHLFYRRLNSRARIGNLLYRLSAATVTDPGAIAIPFLLLWDAIRHRFGRRKDNTA